jgi:hypothetical protein
MIDCSTFLFLNRSTIVRSSGGESPQTHLAVVGGTTYEKRAQIQAPAGPASLHASFRLLASASVLHCSSPLLHFQYEGVLSERGLQRRRISTRTRRCPRKKVAVFQTSLDFERPYLTALIPSSVDAHLPVERDMLGLLIGGLSGGRLVGTDLIECTGVVP